MNTRYTEIFLFLSRLSRRSDKGFAIGFVLFAGVLMAGTSAVMLLRSSSEREKVISQQITAKGINKADVGVARIAYFFNQPQHQKLIKKPTDQWQSVANEIIAGSGSGGGGSSSSSSSSQLQGAACNGSGGSDSSDSGSSESGSSGVFDEDMFNKLLNKDWITIKTSKDVSAGEYRLTGYELDSETDPKFVNLQVEARGLNQDDDTTELSSNNSVRGINVLLPIMEQTQEQEAESSTIPGLWISDSNTSNKQNAKQSSGPQEPINAVTWLDCHQNKDWNKKDKGKYVSDFVHPGKVDQTAIKIGDTNVIPSKDEKDMQVADEMRSIPPIPPGVPQLNGLDLSDCYINLPRIAGNKAGGEKKGDCNKKFQKKGTDTPIGDAYYYRFKGDDSIKLSSAQIRVNPPEGKKVIIFIQGGITMSGKGKSHGKAASCQGTSEKVTTYIGDPDDPSKLEIYSESSSLPIDISDTTMISAFVHAPDTELKISQAQVRGAAWVKKMDASNSGGGSGCDKSIKQMDVGKTLVMGGEEEEGQTITTLGQIASYQSIEAE